MKNDLNFLPEDYLERKAQQRTNVICLVLFLLVAGGVGAAFAVTQQRQHKLKERAAEVTQEMAKASDTLKQLELLEKKKKQITSKASVSAMLMEPVPRSLLLATMTNSLPKGVSLLDYKLVSKEVIAKENNNKSRSKKAKRNKKNKAEKAKAVVPKRIDVDIEFSGVAATDIEVAQLISSLNKSELFKQVNLVFSREHELGGETLRLFKIKTVLDPKARANKEDVEMARRKHIRGM